MKRQRPLDGAKVRRLREDLEDMPTAEMMARKTGLTRQTISEIETGKRPNATRATIMAIAEYLGVKPSDLLVDSPGGSPSGADRTPEDNGNEPTLRAS